MPRTDSEIIDNLVVQAQSGDRTAYSKLVRMMMNQVVALTYKMTGDKETAKDLAQETFISAWENLSGFRRDARFESWLYRIATNKTLNYLERPSVKRMSLPINGNSEMILESAGRGTGASPESELIKKEMREGILRFMYGLPAQQRIVFDLRFYKQLSFNEIAGVTGKSVGTVKTHYREAVSKLREYAIERGWR